MPTNEKPLKTAKPLKRARPTDEPDPDELMLAASIAYEERIRIAEDILEWIDFGKLKPSYGCYLYLTSETDDENRVDGASCTACALGAVFAVSVERGISRSILHPNVSDPNATVNCRIAAAWNMREQLRELFGNDGLLAIERTYEASPGHDRENQMRKIMEPIIEHGEINLRAMSELHQIALYGHVAF